MTSLQSRFSYMAVAIFVAYRAIKIGETPVACIFVDESEGKILSFGCNNTNESLNGTRHAEFEAIDKITWQYNLLDSNAKTCAEFFGRLTVYVTIEPCIMCARVLRQIGVKKVYFGAANDRFGGNGTTIKAQGEDSYPSVGGIMRVEAIHLLRCFYIQQNDSAPVPKIKKNKEIIGKEFPPNLNFSLYSSDEVFKEEFGEERYNIFYSNEIEQEITSEFGKGYNFEDTINKNQLVSLPGLETLYPNSSIDVEGDISTLSQLLPAVGAQGSAYFRVD